MFVHVNEMSFLNVVLADDFISIISDGQITGEQWVLATNVQKFYVSPKGFVVGITGNYEVVNEIKKKFYYQPDLDYEQAQDFLAELLTRFRHKWESFGKAVQFNVLIAGFGASSQTSSALTFHVAKRSVEKVAYQGAASISFGPDDISFNPNELIRQNVSLLTGKFSAAQVQAVQRGALLKVAAQSQTVNRMIFQEIITK